MKFLWYPYKLGVLMLSQYKSNPLIVCILKRIYAKFISFNKVPFAGARKIQPHLNLCGLY